MRKRLVLISFVIVCGVYTGVLSNDFEKKMAESDVVGRHGIVPGQKKVVYFQWQPAAAPTAAYDTKEPEDQHRIILYSGVNRGGVYPVVVGFHGQPKRGKLPRNYKYL